MPYSLPSSLTSLSGPLRLELQRGCADDAVISGLGAFIARSAAEAAREAPPDVAGSLKRLAGAFSGYGSLPVAERRALCERALKALDIYARRVAEAAGEAGPESPPEAGVQALRGVGPRRAETLAQLGVRTIDDLLAHYPVRHDDRRHCPLVAALAHRQSATVKVTVTAAGCVQRLAGRGAARVPATDGATEVNLVWFGQPYRAEQYEAGTVLVVTGQVMIRKGEFSLHVAEVEALRDPEDEPLCMGGLTPVYRLTRGLTQPALRRLMRQALETRADAVESAVPPALVETRGLSPLPRALWDIHFPPDDNALRAARERIAYEELFTLQAAVGTRRRHARTPTDHAGLPASALVEEFRAALPFSPTGAQERVMREVAADLEAPVPAGRLIHGDVGSGKTVCAAFALYVAARAGKQAALMAPTELLAMQHHRVIQDLLGSLGVHCALLVGGMPEAARRRATERIAAGDVPVVVGTHALFQQGVRFRDLAVAVIDEQHRFGVRQRAELTAKGQSPNLLVMSATPIPRTLALTAYGDLDVSVLDELPPGRTPVVTALAWGKDRRAAYETVAHRVVEGRQAYVVCPLVDGGGEGGMAAAENEFLRLQQGPFASFRLGLVHGRLEGAERDRTMEQFRRGEVEILVATTVIEVGVDVPNATVMLVENAERFGMAQLHQLRGRVARGQHPGICMLLTRARSPEVIERLQVLERTHDGFEIAEEDLRRRGPGEMAGMRQSGLPDLRMADLVADTRTLAQAREDAFALLETDPDLQQEEHLPLQRALRRFTDDGSMWTV